MQQIHLHHISTLNIDSISKIISHAICTTVKTDVLFATEGNKILYHHYLEQTSWTTSLLQQDTDFFSEKN